MLTIQTCIDVNVPVQTAYDQWRQFEKFPQFMNGVNQGKQINTYRLYWKAEIAGKGVVTFQPISDVMSTMEYLHNFQDRAIEAGHTCVLVGMEHFKGLSDHNLAYRVKFTESAIAFA